MRFTLPLLTLAFALPALATAQCDEIFISEYCEGTGNNKGLEFYNPTGEAINLSGYQLQRWSNGEGTATDWVDLIGTIAPYGTWVLVNGQTEDVDLGGGATSPACDPIMQAYADQLDNPYPAPTYMNGDDALVLVKNQTTVVDIFGKPGEDPGVAWTNDEANGFIDIGDGAAWLTSNHTLRRKYDVMEGVTVPPISFNTFLQWDTLMVNTWDGLGMHSCACSPNSTLELAPIETAIFPNPTATGSFIIDANQSMERIVVYSAAGVMIQDEQRLVGAQQFTVRDLAAGTYVVTLHFAGGRTFAHRVLVH